MATYSSVASFLFVLGLVILTNPSQTSASISCTDALTDIFPCYEYLLGTADISAPCCAAANTVAQAAPDTATRQELCPCFKQAAISMNINTDRAGQIPQLCQISLPFAISPTINCDTIS